jgi:hypothetical protein
LVKITKHIEDDGYEEEVICSVRYGELILPSKADEHTAIFENERKRARTVKVPRSTFEKDRESFVNLTPVFGEFIAAGFTSPLATADVSFRCGNTTFFAHREVVGKRCDHFGALFHSGMRDANDKEVAIIPACEAQAFRDFLVYLYTDDDDVVNGDNVQELLELASFYQVKRLLAQCEVFLQESIDLENVCEYLDLADRHSALQLKRFCESYIIDHFPKVKLTAGFQGMTQPLLLDITTTACHHLTLATATHHKQAE